MQLTHFKPQKQQLAIDNSPFDLIFNTQQVIDDNFNFSLNISIPWDIGTLQQAIHNSLGKECIPNGDEISYTTISDSKIFDSKAISNQLRDKLLWNICKVNDTDDLTSNISFKLDANTGQITVDHTSPTISVLWDQAVQQAVINDSPGPTIASRAYATLHTAMFDAWAAYDPKAIATQLGDELQRPQGEITQTNKEKAMSFAAYRTLEELFPEQVEIFDDLMVQLGYDPSNTSKNITNAAGIGNVSAEALLEFRRQDGSNQTGVDPNGTLGVPYSDTSGYEASNNISDPSDLELWTPEQVPLDSEPREDVTVQNFLRNEDFIIYQG